MADLPADRLDPLPPFTNVGVDAFGPWSIITRKKAIHVCRFSDIMYVRHLLDLGYVHSFFCNFILNIDSDI